MSRRFRHSLVVGGSGMLAGLCRKLESLSDHLSIMARNEARIGSAAPSALPLVCDYNDGAAVEEALQRSVSANGAPDIVVAWIHGRAPELRRRFAATLAPNGRFVQVLGSAHGDPARPDRLADMKAVADGLPVAYQAVILGFVVEDGRSRWLSDPEISGGVFHAVENPEPVSIVGQIEPWSARP